MSDHLSFHLPDSFIATYSDKPIKWGFDIGGGNSLGELTFLSKYSRLKADGTKETWQEVCERCINGMYSILKNHCLSRRTPWNDYKAQAAAQDAYDRMFNFKWLPPGRGLWVMGTEFLFDFGSSSPLQNCSMLSTNKLSAHSIKEATMPFVRLMEMSMLGIGTGLDTRGEGKLTINLPIGDPIKVVIEDSREGWCYSVQELLTSYFLKNRNPIEFDYSLIRAAGQPLKRFGGTSAGPEPLIRLHEALDKQFAGRDGDLLTSTDIADIANQIGKAVVAGGTRRTAEILFGRPDDEEYLDLKDPEVNAERMGPDGWGFTSNNSVIAESGTDYSHLAERIANNGEPGIVWLDVCRKYSRLIDPVNNRDVLVMGTNPCGEQPLESSETCTLVETFPYLHESIEDYKKTLKAAYLYGKAVTLMSTHWPETNEVMQRNMRIGLSMSGVVQFAAKHGWTALRTWMSEGYDAVQSRDTQYSQWLGVRESIKTTTIKPSGTVSLLNGSTPGVHWPVAADYYIRRMRFRKNDATLVSLKKAGYHVEPDVMDPSHTSVVELPTIGPKVRSEREVSMWEKTELAVLAQRYWSDNAVSVTVTFREDEKDQIPALLRAKDGQLKTLSMLPLFDSGETAYAQMPYEAINAETYSAMIKDLKPLDWETLYAGAAGEAEGEKFCTNDTCTI